MFFSLPAVVPFRQCCRHEDGWSDHYGALHNAAAYAGVVLPARYQVNAVWQHGCFGPWAATMPGALVFNSPAADRVPLLVARREEAEFLQAHGLKQARAIGLPIVYTPECKEPRVARTLLVMPTHTLTDTQFESRALFDRYAAEIQAEAVHFDRVVACVHPNCRANGLWIDEFKARGIEVVLGAQTNDRNALQRMRALFTQFEYVTSNGWGSHIAYALAFGAKVSIFGTEIAQPHSSALRDLAWSTSPAALAAANSMEVQQQKRKFLERLNRAPADGLLDEAWGRWFVGADHQVVPDEMKKILAAVITALPSAVAPAATAQRRHIRQQARELSAAGRNLDAAQLLLRFVRLAADTKDASFILQTLIEISADLTRLDAGKAGVLREQADKLAARMKSGGTVAT